MKRTIFVLLTVLVVFLAVCAVLVLRPVAKVNAEHHGCSNATLNGNYGFVATGFWGNSSATIYRPRNFSMLATFDGKGGFSGTALNMVKSGAPSPYNPNSFTGGTYTVFADCTCTLQTGANFSQNGGQPVSGSGIVVDTGGDEVVGNMLDTEDDWFTATFDAKRVGEGKRGFPE